MSASLSETLLREEGLREEGEDAREQGASLEKLKETWLKGLSHKPRSLAGHEQHLRTFLMDLAKENQVLLKDLKAHHVSFEKVEKALETYQKAPDKRYKYKDAPTARATASLQRRNATVKSFLSFLIEEEYVKPKVIKAVAQVRTEERKVKAFTEEDARKILERAGQSKFASRDKLILALALTMGLSLKEIAEIEIKDLGLKSIKVRGKRGKERVVFASGIVLSLLEEYLPSRSSILGKKNIKEEALIISLRERKEGEKFTLKTSYNGIGKIVDRLLLEEKEEAGWRSHALRATFATLALQNNSYSALELQTMLGHSSLAAVKEYTKVTSKDLEEASKKHPLNR